MNQLPAMADDGLGPVRFLADGFPGPGKLLDLLAVLSSYRATGRIRLHRPGDGTDRLEFLVIDGDLKFATNSRPGDRLGEFLSRRNALSVEKIRLALSEARKRAQLFHAHLMESGLLTKDCLEELLYERAEELLHCGLGNTDGRLTFEESEIPAASVGVDREMARRLVRYRSLWPSLYESFRDRSLRFRRKPIDPALLQERLKREELALLQILDGELTVEQLISGKRNRLDLLYFLERLRRAGLVEVVGRALIGGSAIRPKIVIRFPSEDLPPLRDRLSSTVDLTFSSVLSQMDLNPSSLDSTRTALQNELPTQGEDQEGPESEVRGPGWEPGEVDVLDDPAGGGLIERYEPSTPSRRKTRRPPVSRSKRTWKPRSHQKSSQVAGFAGPSSSPVRSHGESPSSKSGLILVVLLFFTAGLLIYTTFEESETIPPNLSAGTLRAGVAGSEKLVQQLGSRQSTARLEERELVEMEGSERGSPYRYVDGRKLWRKPPPGKWYSDVRPEGWEPGARTRARSRPEIRNP